MKKIFKLIISRGFIASFLLLVQIASVFLLAYEIGKYGLIIYIVFVAISYLFAFSILSRSFNPAYKISWIMLVLMLPVVGVFFYLMFGRLRLSKRRVKLINKIYSEVQAEQKNNTCEVILDDSDNEKLSRYVQSASGFAPHDHSTNKLLTPGEALYASLLEELSKAEHFIFMEYFIIGEGKMWESILEILETKAKQGLDVRVIYDDFGCLQKTKLNFKKNLIAKGIKVVNFNPFIPRLTMIINYRDHRKITVIDGNVGFVGGANLSDEYINLINLFGHWKDTAIFIKGEGVWNLTFLFLQMWQLSTRETFNFNEYRPTIQEHGDGFVQAFGDGPFDKQQIIETAYLSIINQAKSYVYITSPYLVLDSEMVTALKIAGQSGIDVRIIVPHQPDKKWVFFVTQSYYQQLITSGVKIYEYLPGFIHSKTIVSDDKVAMVGTANLDYRSLYYHFEVSALLFKTPTVFDLRDDTNRCFEVSHLVSETEAKKRTLLRKMIVSFLHAFSPMM